MRLSKIKLAGFKSFVDPTIIPFVSNLSAVVGPNGCGKSNVIDAIRWVMGESSAKNLRGGQLTDVIFNGSTTRKPLGQASVELHFDNSDGTLTGEYASYSEVVIRRQVSRDGQSYYYLNGVKCRRRDVMDLFSGTGLNPRGYAIIQQGMISWVVEAKPEELRVFLEEAAGISKYKERRRETENRIHHTRENLERLTDIRHELEKQVGHLKKQSIAAQKFKSLREEEDTLGAQLAALSWQRLNTEVLSQETLIQKCANELQAQLTAHQHIETMLEKQRIEQQALNSQLAEVQAHYYATGSDISNLEQKLQHQTERGVQLRADKIEAQKNLEKAHEHQANDQDRIQALNLAILEAEPIYKAACSEVEYLSEQQKEKEEKLEVLREQWDILIKALENIHRQSDIEKVKMVQLEGQIQQSLVRLTRLQEEQQRLEADDKTAYLESLVQKIQEREHCLAILNQNLQAQKQQAQDLKNTINSLKPDISRLNSLIQQLGGRKASLEALQQAALGKDNKPLAQWLEGQMLLHHKRLAECVQVSEPWHQALEMVLGNDLEALCLTPTELNTALENVGLLQGSLMLLSPSNLGIEPSNSSIPPRLLDYVQWEGNGAVLNPLLENIYVANSLPEALALQSSFESKSLNYSVVTPDGVWLGPGWVRINKGIEEDQKGVLKREQQLRALESELSSYCLELEAKQAHFINLEEAIARCDLLIDDLQTQRNQNHHCLSDETAQLKAQRASLAHKNERLMQIQMEQEEIQRVNQAAQDHIISARQVIAQTIEELAHNTELKTRLETERYTLSQAISHDKSAHRQKVDETHHLALELQKLRTELASIMDNQSRSDHLLGSLTEKIQNLTEAIDDTQAPLDAMQNHLSSLLELHSEREIALKQARDSVSGLDNEIHNLEKNRSICDSLIQTARNQLESLKIEGQALHIHRDNVKNQLINKEFQLEEVLATLPIDANEAAWQLRLSKIETQLRNLGAINLASIEEYETHFERKRYLDEQDTDLNESLAVLQQSIDKIDKETRGRFKETFHAVNENFKVLFPKLFGGGEAHLGLIGENLLESGVSVVARPPGKRNSTIHQLSGGEKALTAVSLVFSIFQLNPAPFCLLDEVDAPLDDNNVGRFCALVKEMSQSVQFIYISHNKLALEMAGALQGVTMREPGVSRIVTVDIEKAAEMMI